MSNNKLTKKQHYYPRCLLKHFANQNEKIHVYITLTNKLTQMNYEKVCASNYTYESSTKDPDNILENKLSIYEARIGKIIDYILNNITSPNFNITDSQQQFILKYMWLQYLRTDAGRINFVTMYEDIFHYNPRTLPIHLDEIQINKEKLRKFNELFKQENVLEKYLLQYDNNKDMNFHIAISEENLITSDNPVIGTDHWKRIMLPISPNLCLQFTHKSIDETKTLLLKLTKNHIDYLNEATINTANYFVISNESFTLSQNTYIYNRFNNPDWNFRKPHFYL